MSSASTQVESCSGVWPTPCCPTHGEPLTLRSAELVCPQGEAFAVRNGIARFVNGPNYADAFGAQWKRYRLTQLDSYTGTKITEKRTRRCLGEELWSNLEGKHVLECGCGAGRFTEVLQSRGACITSVDLSDAVDANQENFPQNARHRVFQASIHSLPFTPRQFDLVFCLGVIQHTRCTEETIARLYEQVKPGGALVIDHYIYEIAEFTKISFFLRFLLKRLPPEEGLRCTESLVRVFLPLHKKVRKVRIAQMILSRISPIACYYRAFPELSDELQREWALVDTHDFLTCWYRRYRTRSQILRNLRTLGLQQVWCEYGGNGVEARGWRPSEGVD